MEGKKVKWEIAKALRENGLVSSCGEGNQVYDIVFEVLEQLMLQEKNVRTPLGVFEVNRVASRRGTNPQNGSPLTIPPKYSIKFSSRPRVNARVKQVFRKTQKEELHEG